MRPSAVAGIYALVVPSQRPQPDRGFRNTNATTIMIGEKLTYMVRQRVRLAA
jgi:hypothetical protein